MTSCNTSISTKSKKYAIFTFYDNVINPNHLVLLINQSVSIPTYYFHLLFQFVKQSSDLSKSTNQKRAPLNTTISDFQKKNVLFCSWYDKLDDLMIQNKVKRLLIMYILKWLIVVFFKGEKFISCLENINILQEFYRTD